MVVSHFFESGEGKKKKRKKESAPLMAGAVALASTGYIARSTERKEKKERVPTA